jgi:hypothetical protein
VERKLKENGVAKIVPDQDLLAKVYAGVERGRRLEEAVEKLDEIDMDDFKAPKDLKKRVKAELKKHPHIRWDAAVEAVVAADARSGAGDNQ